MVKARHKVLLLISLFGFACWFFGNLYEAIVISPNWVVDAPAQLRRLNELFVVTSPTHYFIPLTLLGPVALWLVTFLLRHRAVDRLLWVGSGVAGLAMALNAFIVSTLVLRLFGPDYARHGADLATYAARWNALNAVRLGLVGVCAVLVFQAFRVVDRA